MRTITNPYMRYVIFITKVADLKRSLAALRYVDDETFDVKIMQIEKQITDLEAEYGSN